MDCGGRAQRRRRFSTRESGGTYFQSGVALHSAAAVQIRLPFLRGGLDLIRLPAHYILFYGTQTARQNCFGPLDANAFVTFNTPAVRFVLTGNHESRLVERWMM